MTSIVDAERHPNPNINWATILVDELALGGLKAICIAPGSRSTPLTIAFAAHPAVRIFRHLDERSAAFFALGLSLALDEPVALLCTSGTAAANFYPAIIEARQSHVPLLVLTADRPPELRYSGANQTIDQIKMYGDHVIWSVDLALPQPDAPAVAIRNLRTLAARALSKANGLSKGPVHLNLPFRKPLEPSSKGDQSWMAKPAEHAFEAAALDSPFTRFITGVLTPNDGHIDTIVGLIGQYERGLIVCGPRCQGGDFPEAVSALSQRCGYPLLADPLSGLRYGPHTAGTNLIGGYDTFLPQLGAAWEAPDVVIRFGDVPTSKSLNSYLDAIKPVCRLHVSQNGSWADDSHRVNVFLHADPSLCCQRLAQRLKARTTSKWAETIGRAEAACWRAMDEALSKTFFDGAVVADMVDDLVPGTALFAGNSLPVRHLDQFGRPGLKPIHPYANRGASGIDGNVSTALGVGAFGQAPLVAIMGDITFYHDLNGLLAVKSFGLNPTIVLLNNNGGGIFRRLPIREFDPPFTELFLTPHGLDFEPAARMHGLDFVRADDRNSFRRLLSESMKDQLPTVIEVATDSGQDELRRKELVAFVNDRIVAELGTTSDSPKRSTENDMVRGRQVTDG